MPDHQIAHVDVQNSMAQIAEAVGYESEAAFGNAFRKVVGQPPGQVRRSRAAALTDG